MSAGRGRDDVAVLGIVDLGIVDLGIVDLGIVEMRVRGEGRDDRVVGDLDPAVRLDGPGML